MALMFQFQKNLLVKLKNNCRMVFLKDISRLKYFIFSILKETFVQSLFRPTISKNLSQL